MHEKQFCSSFNKTFHLVVDENLVAENLMQIKNGTV